MTFANLGLSADILRALEEKGYEQATTIQSKAIPAIIEGRDVMAAAQTGTGKTAGFTLPLLEILSKGHSAKSNSVRALILTPTRELAAQVEENIQTYSKHLHLKTTVVFGGVKINPQMMKLRRGADIVVATPGRLMDLYNQNAIKFHQLEMLVLDEADRMLDMGFIADIRKILALLPKRRQNLLFSATFSNTIRQLARGLLHNPLEIDVSPRNTTRASVTQLLHPVDKDKKSRLLVHLLQSNGWYQVLVFARTKRGADRLARTLEKQKIKAAAIHGDKSQAQRTRALEQFKNGKLKALIATDIAARGIDISDLPHVINYELPDVAENYVHRIGRTGRAGAEGAALSLVCLDELKALRDIENLTQELIPREIIEGFAPSQALPETHLNQKNTRPKKAKIKGSGDKNKKPSQARKPGRSKPVAKKPKRNPAQVKQAARNRNKPTQK